MTIVQPSYDVLVVLQGHKKAVQHAFTDRDHITSVLTRHCHTPLSKIMVGAGEVFIPVELKDRFAGHELLLCILRPQADKKPDGIYAGQVRDHLVRSLQWLEDVSFGLLIPGARAPEHWAFRRSTRNI